MAEAGEEGKVLLCSECFAEIGEGSCGDHPDDPPMDPTRPEVRDMLADKDAEALVRLQRKLMGIGAIPGALFGLVAFQVVPIFSVPKFIAVMAAFAFITLVGLTAGRLQANRRFKPRFVRWTGHDYQVDDDIEGMLRESRGP